MLNKGRNHCVIHCNSLCQVDVVKLLLECGAEVDSQTINGITPIHLAAQRGDEKVIEILLKFGANINSVDMYGRGVLHFACINIYDNDTCPTFRCEMLLNKGANVNCKEMNGTTPLHLAIQEYGNQNFVNIWLCSILLFLVPR